MKRMICIRWTACVLAFIVGLSVSAGAPQVDEHYDAPAHFKITTDVVLADVPAFTATAGAFGNSLLKGGGGFEPVVYRNLYRPQEDSPDRIVVGTTAITHYDTLREGFLDGADVRVYRIIDGEMRLVRRDSVPQGGLRCSGWLGVTGGEKVVPAGTTEFTFKWAGYNRPDAPYYFTVSAVDKNGNESPMAGAVSVVRPDEVGKENPQNETEPFKKPRNPSESTAPPAPRGLKGQVLPNGNYRLSWQGVRADDLAGYRVYRSDYPPDEHKGFSIRLAHSPGDPDRHVKAGDMVIVSRKFYSYSRNKYASNRVWGARQANKVGMPGLLDFYPDEEPDRSWELVCYDEDTPVAGGGETCLKLELKGDVEETFQTYNHAGKEQYWYPVLNAQPYTVEIWMRREGAGNGEVTFDFTGYYDGKIEPITFRTESTWQKHTATFTPPDVQQSNRPNQMRLTFSGPGTYYVDNFRVYRSDTGYLDLLPRNRKALKDSGMTVLRTHGPIKTGTTTHDMGQLTNAGGAISGVRYGNTLPQMLDVMRRAEVLPWLQIEMHMAPEEWLGFVEYMAAPYDPDRDTPQSRPWAYKRYRQGQRKPWVEEFDRIYFELSNETWNWLFKPWVFEAMPDAATGENVPRGEVYGKYQEFVRSVMRGSPYWRQADLDEKFVFMLGGWSGNNYGRQAVEGSPRSDYMTIAAYNGGWDEGEGPPQVNDPSYFNVLSQVEQTAIPRAEKHLKEAVVLNQERPVRLKLGTYEAGPGYALNGLNNARVTPEQARQQELVMKSLTAGTATLDSFLCRAYRGFRSQNFFTFSRGRTWSSHAEWYNGGQAYPCWKVLEMFNHHATGDVLRTETVQVPSIDLQKFRRRQAVEDAPLAAVYATRSGDRFSVFVLSRKVPGYPVEGDDGYTPVTVNLPFRKAESITLHRMAGDPRAENIHGEEVKIETVEIPTSEFSSAFKLTEARGADDRGLPPAATLLYVFEGTDAADGPTIPLEEWVEMAR